MKSNSNGRQIAIAKRGKPVARLVPLAEELPDIFGRMKGTGEIPGDMGARHKSGDSGNAT
jgi:antitoxin (DNA-binding transcriptional repressor) of toxin-antitoxin stability system